MEKSVLDQITKLQKLEEEEHKELELIQSENLKIQLQMESCTS